MKPVVEIGIPTYNQQEYIENTINSCLEQNYAALKIIVADDQSTDETGALAKKLVSDNRVQYIRNEKNLGRVDNYHELLYKYADAEWYLNLDGDDYFTDPGFIKHAMEVIGSLGNEKIVFYQANHDLKKVKKALPDYKVLSEDEILVDGKTYFLNFYKIRSFTHCATLYNRYAALPVNFYIFDCLFSDFHSLSRLSLSGKIILSARKVATWREHTLNQSKSLSIENLHRELASLEDVARYAEPVLGKNAACQWLEKMTDYYKMVFIYHNTSHNPGWKTITFIINNWRWNHLYPRYIVKNLLLLIAKPFLKKTK